MDILTMGALAQSEALAAGRLTAVALMEATLARIEAVNGDVNAIVSQRGTTELLDDAYAADKAPRRGWLHGIPMAIKDLSDAAGLETSMGSPIFAGTVARKDSVLSDGCVRQVRSLSARPTRRNSGWAATRSIRYMARHVTPTIWADRLADLRAVRRQRWPAEC